MKSKDAGLRERYELVTRETAEVVTEDRLKDLLKEKKNPLAYIGIEPSGKLHLGHKAGIEKMRDLQEAGFETIILLADMHAHLNEKGDLDALQETAKENKEVFEALGLDPNLTIFILGGSDAYGFSDRDGFQLEPDYHMKWRNLSRHISEKRAIRSMKEIMREKSKTRVSHMIYPIMQVVDMDHLGIDVAVGGTDQRKIHMLAEDKFRAVFGKEPPVFLHIPLARNIFSKEGKMSSSSPKSMIALDDPPEKIREKVRMAYCPKADVANNPLFDHIRQHILRRPRKITIEREEKYGGDITISGYQELKDLYEREKIHPADLKNMVARELIEELKPVREIKL